MIAQTKKRSYFQRLLFSVTILKIGWLITKSSTYTGVLSCVRTPYVFIQAILEEAIETECQQTSAKQANNMLSAPL